MKKNMELPNGMSLFEYNLSKLLIRFYSIFYFNKAKRDSYRNANLQALNERFNYPSTLISLFNQKNLALSEELSELRTEYANILKAQSNTLKRQSSVIKEQSYAIKEYGDTITKLFNVIKEQSEAVKEHTNMLNEHSNAIKEQSEAIKSHSNTLLEYSNSIQDHSNKLYELQVSLKETHHLLVYLIQNNYKNKLNSLREKQTCPKIRVAFLHMYATNIQDIPIFKEMKKDSIFEPYFIVHPDILRSKENADFNYNRSKTELISKFGREVILDGYDYDHDHFVNYSSQFDLVFTNNLYDCMAHEYFKIEYWAAQGIPVCYSNYSYTGRINYDKIKFNLKEIKYCWKIFTENQFSKGEMLSSGINSKNIEVVGYAKLDPLANITERIRRRKKIILAPHHTIFNGTLNLSTFLTYSNVILKLPQLYRSIDFVFRPHPLLIENLEKDFCWGKEKTRKYLQELTENENVEYQVCGDYLDTFVNSDALIHDCGSFLAEYFYTDHPQCYVVKSKTVIDNEYTEFGYKMLDRVYTAYNESDIITFINNVVINSDDYMRAERSAFADNEIKINYPNATKSILNIIKKEIFGDNIP